MQKSYHILFVILLITFNINLFAQKGICESSAQYANFEYISEVSFAGIENSSASYKYYDYSIVQIAKCYVGGSYELKIVTQKYSPSDKLVAWIDWNNDEDFGDEEKIVLDLSGEISQEGNATAQVTIPQTASTAKVKMRIVLQETDDEVAPCGTYDYGETEDYAVDLIVITEEPEVNFTASSNQVFVNDVLQLIDESSNAPTEWEWTITPDSYEFVDGSSKTSMNPKIKMLKQGQYNVSLKATNAIGAGEATKNEFIQVKYYSAPKNFSAFTDANRVLLNWDKPNVPEWKSYVPSIYECDATTWESTERATLFNAEDFDFTYPVTIAKVAHGFYKIDGQTWFDSKFKFRIYASDGQTVLYESGELFAKHNEIAEHVLAKELTLSDAFYVSIITNHENGMPASAYKIKSKGSSHSYARNESGNWELLEDTEISKELCTQIYLAHDAAKTETSLQGYEVYRDKDVVVEINSPDNTMYLDTGVVDGKYNYYVKALYTGMVSSAASNQVSATVDNSVADIEFSYLRTTYENNTEISISGNTDIGESIDLIFSIRNSGNSDLLIDNITLSNPLFTIIEEPEANIASGKTGDLKVRFTPLADGLQTSQLNIESNDTNENPFIINISAIGGSDQWTWMLYLLEDGTGLNGMEDLNEWEANGSINGQVNYVVLYDAQDDNYDGIYLVNKDVQGENNSFVSERIDSPFGVDFEMSEWHTLRDFMLWTKDNYPAKNYGLTMWDHGDGIFKKSGSKEGITKGFVDGMKLWEIDKALKAFTDEAKQKVAIVGFDVCLLGQIETAYQIKDYADYVIASELTEPGDGWDYNAAFKPLNENPLLSAEELAKSIVYTYTESYKPGGSSYTSESTQAATSTKLLSEELIPALNTLCDLLIEYMPIHKEEIDKARDYAWAAPYIGGSPGQEDNPNHRDLGDFLFHLTFDNTLPAELIASAEKCLEAYNKTIVAKGYTGAICKDATGVKIFMPKALSNLSSEQNYYTDNANYLTFSETRWDEFLYAYESPAAIELPVAKFEVDELNPKVNTVVSFTDLSEGNPNTWEWSISPATFEFVDASTKSTQNPKVKFIETGNYKIALTVKNTGGSDRIEHEDYITVTSQVGIDNEEFTFSIYPNPGNGLFRVKLNVQELSGTKYTVFDISGNELKNEALNANAIIDLQSYPSGMYFITIISNHFIKTRSIVKQ